MPDVPQSIPLDLDSFSETVRRQLYERVARIAFASGRYTPDDARLQILYVSGRWLATWVSLEEPPTRPERQRIRIVRIGGSLERPGGIELYDV